MSRKISEHVKQDNTVTQFHVGFISVSLWKRRKNRDKVAKTFTKRFDTETSHAMKNYSGEKKSCCSPNEIRKINLTMFKVLGEVICCIIDKHVSLDSVFLAKISKDFVVW